MNENTGTLAVFNTATESRRAHNRIFEEYRDAHDRAICLPELRDLVRYAYPEGA